MYELIQVGTSTYYINCPAKIGIYVYEQNKVCLIDSGNDKDAGKKILKILEANNWILSMILNTHSHADHTGGNAFLQQRTNCTIYAPSAELGFVNDPYLEPSFLYGGYPYKGLRNKFLNAQPSMAQPLTESILPKGLSMIPLNGHTFSMVGFHTSDDIWFLADCLSDPNILDKYHISYLYDVENYLNTLDFITTLTGTLFIPSHAEPTKDVTSLVSINKEKVHEIIDFLKKFIRTAATLEDLVACVFAHYGLQINDTQYVLISSTIRSYLSYLHGQGCLMISFSSGKMFFQTI